MKSKMPSSGSSSHVRSPAKVEGRSSPREKTVGSLVPSGAPSTGPQPLDTPDVSRSSSTPPAAPRWWTLASRVKLRPVYVFFIAYHIYLLLAIRKSWTSEQDWCTDPKFMTVLTLVFHAVTITVTLAGIWTRMREGPLRRLDSSVFYVKEKGVHRAVWFGVIASVVAVLSMGEVPEIHRLVSILGVALIVLICYMFSYNRKKISWNVVLWGVLLQFLLGTVIIRVRVGRAAFICIGEKVKQMLNYAMKGSEFTFGFLATGNIGTAGAMKGPIFAFKVIPMAVYFSFMLAVAVHYGFARWMIYYTALGLHWTTGATPCDTLCAATNILVAQNDIPWILHPYISEMTLSEIHTAMASGFGSLSGPTFAALLSFGMEPLHLMAASVMSAPASLVTSKMLFPEMEKPVTRFDTFKRMRRAENNALETAFCSVRSMLKVLFVLCANLIACIAFIEFLNAILKNVTTLLEWNTIDVQSLVGCLFIPMSLMMGVPYEECEIVARLIGVKTYINELVAFLELKDFVRSGFLTKRSQIIATYALCGFSNFSSIGIQLAAWSTMGSRRIAEFSALSMRALLAGILCDFMTGCVAGALVPTDEEGTPVKFDALAFLNA